MKNILKAIRNMIDGVYHYVDDMVRKATESKPDWNQNDPTAPDYVKNRPFWTDDPVETVLFEGTVVNDDDPEIELIVGQEYTVTLDGVEYVLTAWDGGYGSVVIGSESIWWETDYVDTEPPFAVGVWGDGSWFYTLNEGEEHTLRVLADISEVHKIDEKYLPDSIVISENIDPKYIGQIFLLDTYEKIYFDELPESYNDTKTVGDVTLDTWKEFVKLLLDDHCIIQYGGRFLDGVRGVRLSDDLSYYDTIVFSINTVRGGENFVECSTESFTFEYDETNKTVELRCDYRIGFAYNVETNTITPIT